MTRKTWFGLAGLVALLLALVGGVRAQGPPGTVYTYQGCLLDAKGKPLNGKYDLQFTLYDAPAGGSPVGDPIEVGAVSVVDCWCTVQLKFDAAAFDGWGERYVEVGARRSGKTDPYTPLLREAVLPAPSALNAELARQQATPVPSFGEGLVLSEDNVLSVWFEGSGSASTAARSDHEHAGNPYTNVVVVAASGGDFGSIQAALDSITDATADNRYLVWIAPGTYAEPVTMKPYVDIEGAGELTTKITSAGRDDWRAGTVVGADDAELRFLTVESTGGSAFAVAIYNGFASPRLTHVSAVATGGDVNAGIVNESCSPKMTDVTATASGGDDNVGILNESSSPTMINVTATASEGNTSCGMINHSDADSPPSSPTMINVTATASGGVENYGIWSHNCAEGQAPTIRSSVIHASGGSLSYGVYSGWCGIYPPPGSGIVRVDNSQITASTSTVYGDYVWILVGASLLDGGDAVNARCAGVYDENYAFYADTCP